MVFFQGNRVTVCLRVKIKEKVTSIVRLVYNEYASGLLLACPK